MQELSVLRGIMHHMNMDWLFALHNKVKQNLLYSVFFVFDISQKKKKSLMSLCDVVMADLMKCLFAAKPKCI